MVTPKWVSSLSQPIWIENVISYLSQAPHLHLQGNITVQIGGPDKVSYKELMREYRKQSGYKRAMISVPVLTPRLSSLRLGLVTPVYARAGRKLIDSLTTNSVITDNNGLKLFGVDLVGYKEAISKTIESENYSFFASRWFDLVSSGTKKLTPTTHTMRNKRHSDISSKIRVRLIYLCLLDKLLSLLIKLVALMVGITRIFCGKLEVGLTQLLVEWA